MTDQELKEVQMMIVQALTAIDELIEARKKIEEL